MSLTSVLPVPGMAAALLGGAVLLIPPSGSARLRRLRPGANPAYRIPGRANVAGPERWRTAGPVVAVALLTVAVGGFPGAVPVAAVTSGLTWFAVRRLRRGRARSPTGAARALRLAATGDLLAACLRAGMPVPSAVRAVAGTAPADAARALRSTADLLALGAEPAEAWEPARRCDATAELARAAYRTARSGSALAGVAAELAERARSAVTDEAEARAARAGVLITGPLGLCFLPAFLCLGVIPVVLGLADRLTVFS